MDLCVTADDYGLSSALNAGIERLAARGVVRAVSVMVHADAELGGVARLRDHGVAVGLHLVLVAERPLHGPRALAPLLEGTHLPGSWWRLLGRLARRPQLAALVRRETEAQLERYLGLGLPLDFFNSHQHVHLLPPVWAACHPTLRAHPRAALRGFGGVRWQASKVGLASLAARCSWALRPPRGRRTLEPLALQPAGALSGPGLTRLLAQAPPARARVRAELVVHPGEPDAATSSRYASWGYDWGRELEFLSSAEFRAAVDRGGAVLVGAS
jgi:chitin disaccharide deacetylase